MHKKTASYNQHSSLGGKPSQGSVSPLVTLNLTALRVIAWESLTTDFDYS